LATIARNIIEHPDVADPQPVLRPAQSSQSLDSATARFLGLVPEIRFERSSYSRPNVRFQALKIVDSFWGEDDVERHSGQIIARYAGSSKIGKSCRDQRWRGSGSAGREVACSPFRIKQRTLILLKLLSNFLRQAGYSSALNVFERSVTLCLAR
jgi:hypothetical protein